MRSFSAGFKHKVDGVSCVFQPQERVNNKLIIFLFLRAFERKDRSKAFFIFIFLMRYTLRPAQQLGALIKLALIRNGVSIKH